MLFKSAELQSAKGLEGALCQVNICFTTQAYPILHDAWMICCCEVYVSYSKLRLKSRSRNCNASRKTPASYTRYNACLMKHNPLKPTCSIFCKKLSSHCATLVEISHLHKVLLGTKIRQLEQPAVIVSVVGRNGEIIVEQVKWHVCFITCILFHWPSEIQ